MKKIVLIIVTLFVTSVLAARDVLVVDYATNPQELQEELHKLTTKYSGILQKTKTKPKIEKLGDRYLLVLEPISSLETAQTLQAVLVKEFDDMMVLRFSAEKKSVVKKASSPAKVQPKEQDSIDYEWVTIYLLSFILVLFFLKGMRELFMVRKSQKLLQQQQQQIESELKEL